MPSFVESSNRCGPGPLSDGSVLVRGGTVVTASGRSRTDVRIVNGRIAEVGPDLDPNGQIVDAGGLHVLPGILDSHHHQWEPGLASRPDFRDDTASAAAGGITTILDHPLTPPEVLDGRRFRDKLRLGERTSFVDFALHGGASPDRLDGLVEQWNAGATGFKIFTCETGVPMGGFVNPADRLAVMQQIASLHAIALVHAEDQVILDRNRERLRGATGRPGEVFGAWRSAEAEIAAAADLISIAAPLGARLYFVHTSTPVVVDLVTAARSRGEDVSVETCPHYLTFTEQDLAERGMWIATAPPVRDVASRDDLRRLLAKEIDVIGSDHGSVLPERKEIPDPFVAQAGVPGNETMVPLLLDLAARGVLTLERIVALTSTNPARIFALSDRKGAIAPGLDGDLTLVDLTASTIPMGDRMVGVAGWTPYERMEFQGSVTKTIIRGVVVATDGRPIQDPGFGRFIRRGGVSATGGRPRTGKE